MRRPKAKTTSAAALAAAILAATLSPVGAAAAAGQSDDLGLVMWSRDGDAFDFAEYDGPGSYDIAVDVITRSGRGFSDDRAPEGSEVRYYWSVQPFDPSLAPIRVPAGEGTYATNAEPRYNGLDDVPGGDTFDVRFPAGETAPGVHTLHAALVTPDIATGPAAEPPFDAIDSVTAGNAELTLDQSEIVGDFEEAVMVSGTLALEDGTTLPRRYISLDYAPEVDRGIRSATFLPYASAYRSPRAQTSTGRMTNLYGAFDAYLAGHQQTPCESSRVAESGTLSVTAEQIPADSPILLDPLGATPVQGSLYAPADPIPTKFGQELDESPVIVDPGVSLFARSNGGQDDSLLVRARRLAAGEVVRLYRSGLGRGRQLVGTRRAGYHGNAGFTVPDRNGRRPAVYRAVVLFDAACAIPSNKRRIR